MPITTSDAALAFLVKSSTLSSQFLRLDLAAICNPRNRMHWSLHYTCCEQWTIFPETTQLIEVLTHSHTLSTIIGVIPIQKYIE